MKILYTPTKRLREKKQDAQKTTTVYPVAVLYN